MQSELDSLRGWAVVAAALVATTVLLGISYSFGVLVEPVAAEFDTGRGGAGAAFALTVAALPRGDGRLHLGLDPARLLVPSAIDRGVAATDAAWLLAFAGASNVGARLLVPLAAARLGLLPSYRVSLVALAACGPLWMPRAARYRRSPPPPASSARDTEHSSH